MKDVVNPLLLVVLVVLLGFRIPVWQESAAAQYDVWILGICGTAFLVDFCLAVSRALVRRPALMPVVWGTAFLIIGCAVFALPRAQGDGEDPTLAERKALLAEYRRTGDATLRSTAGESLLELASGANETALLKELLQKPQEASMRSLALQCAAEKGHRKAVALLLPGTSLNEPVRGSTPLVAAASVGYYNIVEDMLKAGADPNFADAAGTPPLIHAVLVSNVPTVRVLLKYGASPQKTDADGQTAADYSRSDEIDALLQAQQP